VLLVLALGCLAVSAYLIGELVTTPARERAGALRRAMAWGRTRRSLEAALPLQRRTLQPLKERVARLVLRVNPKVTVDQVAFRLLAAGVSRRISPTGFLAGKAGLAIGGFAFGLLIGMGKSGMLGVVLGLGFAAVGFIGPDMYVNAKGKSRRERIRADLPDALDLLAVSVEAGLGFDAAIAKVTEKMKGALSEEFALTLSEIRIGESRIDALKKLAERTATPEVSAFTRSIIQAWQDPARAGDGQPHAPSGGGRGASDESADQDALPDGDVHLPVDVPRHARAGVPRDPEGALAPVRRGDRLRVVARGEEVPAPASIVVEGLRVAAVWGPRCRRRGSGSCSRRRGGNASPSCRGSGSAGRVRLLIGASRRTNRS
jgi:tight adherence protein C